MFLLDTNILGLARRSKPHHRLSAWLDEQECVAIPFPAILEIQRGIASLRERDPSKALELTHWLDNILESEFEYPEITVAVARLHGEMHCCRPLKQLWHVSQGRDTKPGQDLFIAAIAIVHNLPIATLDAGDFQRIDSYFPLPGVYHPVFRHWIVEPGTQEASAACVAR
ncbi:PIN domain-containing protein [Pararhizobium gei]|uniref:PIN domain-containing protein n=1 Tax=Pararhizobium gei TaxID=1395951 RepID=UPI0023DA75CF|nr:PIN domain-containing protein [Rhizobium gei]